MAKMIVSPPARVWFDHVCRVCGEFEVVVNDHPEAWKEGEQQMKDHLAEHTAAQIRAFVYRIHGVFGD